MPVRRVQGAHPASRNVTSDDGLPTTEQERRSHETLHFSFHGRGATLFGIQVVNVLLTLMTLGWYHFRAKAKVRRYVFNQTACAGDRFAYHGTGKELFKGFLKAMVVFGIPYFCLTAAAQLINSPPWISFTLRSLGGILLFLYVPIAMVAARRYRCSRASWRGIRFRFHGTTSGFSQTTLHRVVIHSPFTRDLLSLFFDEAIRVSRFPYLSRNSTIHIRRSWTTPGTSICCDTFFLATSS